MPIELTFREWDRHEPDEWSRHGQVITETNELNKARQALSEYKVLVVKHWHYRGSRAPSLTVVEDYESLVDYLSEHAVAGDAIDLYDITDALVDSRRIASGKCPDEGGMVPRRGAY